ncbi:MAG TPA: winged helix-turn-helix domain-containing protein [Candidatus Angelobacter sp.]|nr:winged helix-turn-helix domain-containing protein [Candidatus Angelobacter sp.]
MLRDRQGQVLRFGAFDVNLSARELRKHGTRVRLPGQPFCILAMLLEKPGEVVTREEMQRRLWASDTFVDFEHSLNSAIKKLRAALTDSPENPRYVETIPRVGYRFIAPVEEIPLAGRQSVETAPAAADVVATASVLTSRRYQVVMLVGIFVILVIAVSAGYSLWSRWRARPQPVAARLMLAVLPFENLTGDAGQEYFSDGLTEEMISQLGRLDPEHLGVIARTSVMHYKNNQKAMDQIGRELAVQYVLEGSVRRDGDKVRVTAQLVEMKNQTPIWSRQYDRELSGLLTLQGEIAQEIADEIQITLGSGRKVFASDRKPPVSPNSYEAYDLYLKGRYFWNKRTKEGFQQAAEFFQQSITKDPNYARAYAGLADTFGLMSTWSLVAPNEFMPKARAAALSALQIDDSLAEAHTSLALVAENYDYDWQTAEKEYRRAIELDPGYATAHQWYAECLSFQGRFEEALAESERARQLDPLSLIIATDHGAILYFSRQYDRAIEEFLAVQAMEPNFSRAHMVTLAYVEKGMFAEAFADADKWHHSDGTPVWEVQAFILARAGQQEQARRMFAKWELWHKGPQAPVTFAPIMAYVGMRRNDEAIALLQKSYAEHSNPIMEINVAPYCDPLRSDPRFQDLLRRVGFADSSTTGTSTAKP